jgi:hypothetical protein
VAHDRLLNAAEICAGGLAFASSPVPYSPPQLAFAAGDFIEQQKNQIGEFFS